MCPARASGRSASKHARGARALAQDGLCACPPNAPPSRFFIVNTCAPRARSFVICAMPIFSKTSSDSPCHPSGHLPVCRLASGRGGDSVSVSPNVRLANNPTPDKRTLSHRIPWNPAHTTDLMNVSVKLTVEILILPCQFEQPAFCAPS